MRLSGYATIFGSAVFLTLISTLVVPAADDFCSLYQTRDNNFWQYMLLYFIHMNGRIASGAATYLTYSQGTTWFLAINTAALAILVVLWAYALRPVTYRLFGKGIRTLLLLPATLLACLFLVSSVGDHTPYELIHWMPGIISYSLPLTLSAILWHYCLHQQYTTLRHFIQAASAFWLLATFHELIGPLNVAVVAAIFVVAHYKGSPLLHRALAYAAIAGSSVGLLTIYLSPGSTERRLIAGGHGVMVDTLIEAGTDTLHYGQLVLSKWGMFSIIGVTMMGAFLYLTTVAHNPGQSPVVENGPRNRLLGLGVISCVISLYGIQLISRSLYGTEAPERMLIYFYLAYIPTLLWLGACLGRAILRDPHMPSSPANRSKAVSIIITIGMTLTMLGMMHGISQYGSMVNQRLVDYRQTLANNSTRNNTDDILIVEITPTIPGLGEPGLNPKHWINTCTAHYFDAGTAIGQ